MILSRVKQCTTYDEVCQIPKERTCLATDEIASAGLTALQGLAIVTPCKENAFITFETDNTLAENDEAYAITITKDAITVRAKTKRGSANAAATLAQILTKDEIPTCEIFDYPDTGYRSYMLDMARGIPTMAQIKNAIKTMALAKYNKLHLHLMDSQGICFHSSAMPKLGEKYGRQMEVSDLKDIIAYAESFQIDVIPEIEIPFHAKALVNAYPELACDTDTVSYWAACPGTDSFWELFENLIREVADIFPYEYFHVGGDEIEFLDAPQENSYCNWDSCSKCRALRERVGIRYVQEQYYYVMNWAHDIVKSCGKKMIMWNDQIDISRDVPLSRDILIQFWRVAGRGRGPYENCSMQGFLENGFKVINSYYPYTYCDFEIYMSLEKLSTWTPYTEPKVPEEYKHLMVGGESCAWEFGNVEVYPFYAYTAAPAILLFGDKLWDYRDRTYTEDDRIYMAEALFGKTLAKDIYTCIGAILPPRNKDEFTYVNKEDISKEWIEECKAEIAEKSTALCEYNKTEYINLLDNISKELFA